MRTLVAALVTIAMAPTFAQQPASAPATLTLRGVVTTANDVPLPRVRVAPLRATATEPPVLTDEQGQFTVRVADTESVRLSFTKAGYATSTVDLRRSDLVARAGTDLRVRLSQGGAVSGQVRDRSGAPVMLAPVTARRLGPLTASDAPVLTTTTNDLGEFRFGGLALGAYAIAARPPASFSTAAATQSGAAPKEPAEQTVNVGLGAEIGGIDATIDMPSELNRPSGGTIPVDPEATASLRGRVVTPQGAPIAGAVVQAYRSNLPTEAVESDARGRYVSDRLPPGDYRVRAFKHGFIDLRPGQGQNLVEILLRDTSAADRIIPLRRGQVADSLDVTLARGGAIAGTIVDEFGEPMQGVAVSALELRVMGGRTRALRVATARDVLGRTDDRGRYRLFGLQPGTYVIQAVAGDLLSGTNGYVPLFHPGAPTVDLATPTRLGVDATVTGIDVALQPLPAHRIRGRVLDPAGNPARVMLTLMVSERSGAIQTEPATARPNADGTFAFNNVAPGDYVVQATATDRAGPSASVAVARQFVAAFVTVTTEGPPPLELKLSQGATLMGRVVYEGVAAPARSGIALVALAADFDRGPLLAEGAIGFSLLPDNTFEYRGVFGPSFLLGQPRNPEWYVKSISFRGQDLTDSPFDFGSTETFHDIEVVVSAAGATATGRVTDDRAAPVRDYTVVLFPTDRGKWTLRSRWLKTGRATQEGAFRVTGLVPGEYWVVAVDRLDGSEVAGDLQNPAVLESLSSRATRITLGEGQSQDLTLRLIRR